MKFKKGQDIKKIRPSAANMNCYRTHGNICNMRPDFVFTAVARGSQKDYCFNVDTVTSFCSSTISHDSLQRSCTSATGSSLESPAHIGRWVGKKSSPPLERGKTRGTTQSELRKCAEKWNFCRSSTTHQLQLQKSPDIISFL